MARFLTLMAISICGVLLAPSVALAQSDQEDSRCFPWQEFRDGACVAKPAQDTPSRSQSRQLTTTPRDDPPPAPPAPAAVAPPPIPPPLPAPVVAAPVNVLCDGGTVSGSTCACPAGYALLPATSGNGGTCVQTNAENCRGGVQTVAGVCLCDGRVTMSGETYALEFLSGKCVPKRCPDRSYLKNGQCVASNDTRFAFTCRTGYMPDETVQSTAATGLRCVPDPSFCPPELKKSGACGKSAAIAIDCFEGRCTCGPNADWVNYLCQCTSPYRNVNGTCVSAAVADTGDKKQPGKPELASEPSHKQKACGRGMVRTRSGSCVAARPRLPDAGQLGVYYQRAQRYRDYPGQPGQPQDIR